MKDEMDKRNKIIHCFLPILELIIIHRATIFSTTHHRYILAVTKYCPKFIGNS